MNYPVIAEHLTGRTSRVSVEQREETKLRARVHLNSHLAPGASAENKGTARRYLRSPLDHLDIIVARDVTSKVRRVDFGDCGPMQRPKSISEVGSGLAGASSSLARRGVNF